MFLRSHDLPPRSQKYNGKTVDGGSHSVESLWEAIRTGIQQKGRTRAIRKHPVQSFFEHGYKAVESDYYHMVVTSFSASYPNEPVYNRWEDLPCTKTNNRIEQSLQGVSTEKSVRSFPTESSAALSSQVDQDIGPLGSERKRDQSGLAKEVVQLFSG